ncbi:hypothetical protein D3C87_2039810 [compost metagenome]
MMMSWKCSSHHYGRNHLAWRGSEERRTSTRAVPIRLLWLRWRASCAITCRLPGSMPIFRLTCCYGKCLITRQSLSLQCLSASAAKG